MKILVISDIHGRRDRLREALSIHKNADAVFFLGDGVRDIAHEDISSLGCVFAGVRGNCDGLSGSEYSYFNELKLDLGEYTVLMMHGHTHSVKSGIDRAVRYAAERGADILLYGHTHVAEERYLPDGTELEDGYLLPRPMWIMNPGSLGEPRGDMPSYGLIQIQNGQILMSHGIL